MMDKNPVIVILHGWGRFTNSWAPVKKELEEEGFSVFYPPLPGLDAKQPLDRPWSVGDYVDWVAEFASQNNLERFFLVGHSFGGRVAIKFSVTHQEKLRGLILVASAGLKEKTLFWKYSLVLLSLKTVKKLAFLPGYQLLRKLFYRFVLRKTDYLVLDGVMKETFKKVVEEDLTPWLPRIQSPTLILWGEKDQTTPLADGRLMAKAIPGSQLKIIPVAGHKLHEQAPQIVAREISRFIKAH